MSLFFDFSGYLDLLSQPLAQHRYTGIIEQFFSKPDSYSDSVLVYLSNLTNIIMTSTLWTSSNSKRMLTNAPERRETMQKNDADVHRNLITVAAILFPHFKGAC